MSHSQNSSLSGKFDRTVEFEADIVDESVRVGLEPKKTTVSLAKRRASAQSIMSGERFKSGQEFNKNLVRLWLRYFSNVNNAQRFKLEGRLYQIISVAELGRRQKLEIVGEEIQRDVQGDKWQSV
jgi:SPP1 family predicted phage head-tail adaptor